MEVYVKFSLLLLLILSFQAFATPGASLLDSEATIPVFGKIKYRAPKVLSDETPIVLFHGIYGGASHRTWRKLLPELEALGKEVYIMDLPGAGESAKPNRAYSIEDFDRFVEVFLEEVVRERANIVSESILSNGVLRAAATRPDLVRRAIVLNPSGVTTLNKAPSEREQRLYDRLIRDDEAAIAFYRNLLNPNSIGYYLSFGFYDDTLIDDALKADFIAMRDNIDQRFLTLSFVGGQLYRTFEESSQGVFIPVLVIFGKEYEAFQDNKISTAADFKKIRPYFEYAEIEKSGASVQREKPKKTAQLIVDFLVKD